MNIILTIIFSTEWAPQILCTTQLVTPAMRCYILTCRLFGVRYISLKISGLCSKCRLQKKVLP
nr:MAG TPA: Manganese responsive transcriptional regulator member, ferric uptake regulator, apo [Caudoviricetes sp.]